METTSVTGTPTGTPGSEAYAMQAEYDRQRTTRPPRISDFTLRQQTAALRAVGDQRHLSRTDANAAVLAYLIATYRKAN